MLGLAALPIIAATILAISVISGIFGMAGGMILIDGDAGDEAAPLSA